VSEAAPPEEISAADEAPPLAPSQRIRPLPSPNRFAVPFLLVLLLAALLRLLWLGADPPLSLSLSNSEVMDGPWYMAEAVDRARVLPTDVPASYRRPLLTETAAAFFGILGGPSLERAHLFAAAWGVLLTLAGGLAGRIAFGARAGLLAAFFLATSFVLTGYGRTPLVQGPLAASLAVVFLVQAWGVTREGLGARLGLQLAAGLLALGVAATLKEGAVAILPGIALGILLAATDRRRAVLAVAALCLLAVGAAWLFRERAPERLDHLLAVMRSYLGRDPADREALAVVKRIANAPVHSGLAVKEAPLLALAWLGALLALLGARTLIERDIDAGAEPAREAQRRRAQALEAALAAWLVASILLFAPFRFDPDERRIPLRHFAPALVPAALLAARALDRVRGGVLLPSRPGALLLAYLWGAAGGYVAISLGWTAYAAVAIPESGPVPEWFASAARFAPTLLAAQALGLAAAGLVVLHARRSRPLTLGPLGFGLVFGAVVVGAALRHIPVLAAPTFTLREANERAAGVIMPSASVEGPYAHMLTWRVMAERHQGVPLVVKEPLRVGDDPLGRKRFTHFAVDATPEKRAQIEAIYGAAGVTLTPVLDVRVRGYPVVVYRYPWAPASPGEGRATPSATSETAAPRSR